MRAEADLIVLLRNNAEQIAQLVDAAWALDTTLVAFREATKSRDLVRLAIEAKVLDAIEPVFRAALHAMEPKP